MIRAEEPGPDPSGATLVWLRGLSTEKIIAGWGLEAVHEFMGLGGVLPAIWSECDEGGGMHYCGQRSVAVELIDPSTGEQLPWEAGDAVTTRNPFAVNDVWFSSQTGVALAEMNTRGNSLIYGHPQGPTGTRLIVELIHTLAGRGGGVGLFTGCAAGDSGAAVFVRVED